MRITLIQPGLSVKDRYGEDLGKVGPTCEPMGLAYLAAIIRQENIAEVNIIDIAAENLNTEQLTEMLNSLKPDIVGISILTPMYLRAKETISLIRGILPDAKIIAGGPHVTVFPKIALEENTDIDIAFFGEAEGAIVDVIKAIYNKEDFRGINGIAYRENGKIVINKPREINQDLDSIPLPARDLLPMNKYRPAPTYFKKLPSYLILASRGCPFNCAYCSKVSGKVYRKHSVARIIKEICILLDEYGARDIIFRDDTFTIDRNHIIELCKEILRLGLNKRFEWSCMTRVNLVDKELLCKMKEAGCWSIHYGVESGNQRLLNLIDKGITLEQVRNAFKWTREAGIEIKAFFMLGLPTETRKESFNTIAFSKKVDPDWVQFTITVPYPGTKLFEITKKDKTLKSYKWENYQTWAGWSDKELVYIPEGRNGTELKELQKYAMRCFYLRPRFIIRQLKYISSKDRLRVYLAGATALIKSAFKNS